jgi:transcriptional regulator with XRE-family HTH domain
LARRLGVSPKTIQSWETGRTFLERLDVIPRLEAELGCRLSSCIAKAAGSPPGIPESAEDASLLSGETASEAPPPKQSARIGPLAIRFDLSASPLAVAGDELERNWVAAPVLRPGALLAGIANLSPRDIVRHVAFPGEWAPKAGALAALRMGDSAMMPMIPLGATVIADMRPKAPEKMLGKVAVIGFVDRGVRVRRLVRSVTGESILASGVVEHGRAMLQFRPDKKDRILGEVIGILAAVR